MGEPYFRFKQFSIWQPRAAQKVSTEACVLGAVTPLPALPARLLDVGTGTGLLALMMAQRLRAAFPAGAFLIDALEPDAQSLADAARNVAESSFQATIVLHQKRLQDFFPEKPYELIVSNPPFFQQDLRAARPCRNTAAHADALPLPELATHAARLLAPAGLLAVLLPPHEASLLTALLAPLGLVPEKKIILTARQGKSPFRHVALYRRQPAAPSQMPLTILDETGHYTPDFVALLRDFYLFL